MVDHSLPWCSISSKFWIYVNCHVGLRRIHQDHQFHHVPGPGIGSKSIRTTPEAWRNLMGSHGPWLSLVMPCQFRTAHLQPWSYPRILHPKAAGCGARERASSGQTRWMRNNVINGFNGLLDANCIAATVAMFCNFDVFINLLFGCGRWAAGLNMSLAKKPSELIGQRWVQVKCPQLIRSLRMPALPCLTQLSNAPSSRLLGKSVFL